MHTTPDLSMNFGLTVAESMDPQCKNCGTPPETFEINGEVKPNRMTTIRGRSLAKEHAGVYCEKCVAVANRMAAEKRSRSRVRN